MKGGKREGAGRPKQQLTPAKLREARITLGLTQAAMAKMWGYTDSYIQRMELGTVAIPRLMGDAVKWKLHENKIYKKMKKDVDYT